MVRLTQDQRTVVLDKFPDVANLAVGALVFGQFLGDQYSLGLAAAGIATWSALIVIVLVIAGGSK